MADRRSPGEVALLAVTALAACGGGGAFEPGEGPPARLEFPAAAVTSGFAGNVMAPQPVRVLDGSGRPLEGVEIRFRVEGGGRLAWTRAASDARGYASPGGWRLGEVSGLQRLVAEAGPLSASLPVQVSEPSPSGFSIELYFERDVGLSPVARLAIVHAAALWETLIVGDLPDTEVPNVLPEGCPAVPELRGKLVDDLLIIIWTGPISGAAGTTKLCARRTGSGLPAVAYVRLDPLKAARVEGAYTVMKHEIAHALGFGTIWFGALLSDDDDNPLFLGPSAVAAYRLALGRAKGAGVPLEAGSGAGRPTHWRESLLDQELLTPLADPEPQPVSAITIGALRDLGYLVDDSKADAFAAPSISAQRHRGIDPSRASGGNPRGQ